MDAFDLDVLGRVSMDHEAVHTIRADLERDLGRSVPADEIESALARLAIKGLVDAFVFDPAVGNYRKVVVGSLSPTELWFYISSIGRSEYDRWVA